MKGFRQSLSLFLAFAVIATMICMPITGSAATQSVDLVNTDFEDWQDDFSWPDMTAVDNTVKAVDSGDSARGKVLALGTDSSATTKLGLTKEVNATTGTVDVSLWAKAPTTRFDVRMEDSNNSTQWIARLAGNGTSGVTNGSIGEFEIDWGSYGQDQWNKIEISVDISGKTVDVSIISADNQKKTVAKDKTFSLTDIKNIKISANDRPSGLSYIDDLKITVGGSEVINEDFEGFKTISSYGFNPTNYVSVVDTDAGVHGTEHGKVLAIGQSGDSGQPGIKTAVNAKTGTLTVSADVWQGGSQWLQFRVADSSGTARELIRIYSHASGYSYAFNSAGGENPDNWQAPAYTDAPAGWWKFTISLNLGAAEGDTVSGSLNVDLPNGKNHKVDCTLPFTDIATVEIRNNSTCSASNLVDNLNINHTYTEAEELPEGYLFLEDFDDITTIKGDSRFYEDFTGNTNLEIRDKALAVTDKATKAVVMNLSEPVTSGKVTWSMKVTPGNNYFNLLASDEVNVWSNKYTKSSIGDNSQLNVANTTAYPGVAGTAYTFNAMYDLDNDKATSQWVAADGTILVENTHTDFTYNQLAAVAFQGGWTANCSVTYFDDISVRVGDHLVKAADSNILWEEDFDSMTLDSMENLTYNSASTVVSFTTVGGAETNSIGVAKATPGGGQAEITKSHTNVSEDCVRYTYSLYVDDRGSTPIYIKDAAGKNYLLVYLNQGSVYHSGTNASPANRVCSYETGWVYLENIVNLETKSNTINVYDAQGGLLASGVDEEFSSNDTGTPIISDIASFNLRNWADYTTYLDDIKIEKFIARPELTNSSVTMTDYKGDAVADITNPTPGITTITLNFGTAMKADSLTGAVTLKQDNTDVSFTGAISGSMYIMTVSGLEPEKAYKLTVANTVENTKDQTMATAFVLNFTTTKGSTAASLISIKEGDAEAKLADIATGDTLTIDAAYENILAGDMSITYIVAYYSGTMLADVQVIEEASSLTGAGTLSQTFSAKDMTGVTGITVFMWDSAYGAYPYCVPIVID